MIGFDSAALLMFPALFLLIFLGFPVAFCLIVVGAGFGFSVFGWNIGLQMHGRLLDVASNFVLVAIPLFIFMGALFESSSIAKRLFEALSLLLGRVPGGLGISVIIISAIFAASAGVVGAVEIVVGMMAVPHMLKAGYKSDLTSGSVCAGGSLGTIIPPSILAVIYATSAELPIGDVLAGTLLPGLIMALLFGAYVFVRCIIDPKAGPVQPPSPDEITLGEKLWKFAVALLPCLGLIAAVLGSIFAGVASPTEAAALGSAGAILVTIGYGDLTWKVLLDALRRTAMITSMTMMIILGGTIFTSIFLVLGGGVIVRTMVGAMELGPDGLIWLFLAIILLLGFVLDWASIILITVPIFTPVLVHAGVDPLWFAIMACVVLQTSYLTPPMAPSIFYLRAIAPPEVTYRDMYIGVLPFIGVQILTLMLVYYFSGLATYMPSVLFGF